MKIESQVIIAQLKSDPCKEYEILDLLGEGSFGKVVKVKSKITNMMRAMKTLNHGQESKENELKLYNDEISILKKMDHPNILKIFESYVNDTEVHIVTELCNEGELFDEINSHGPFKEKEAAFIIYQLLSGISYCHGMNITHRDLKPDNILISKRDNDNLIRIKICDFGTSMVFKKNIAMSHQVGTIYYIAPEVLKEKYDEKCDLWSIGVILYILLTGKPPFNGKTDPEIEIRIVKGEYDLVTFPWDNISPSVKDLIRSLLCYDPKKRISAKEALDHEWFKMYGIANILNSIDSDALINKYIENLKTYKTHSLLQETSLAYLVHNFPEMNEIAQACKLFNQINTSNNGKISKEELFNGLSSKISMDKNDLKTNVDAIFDNIDMNKNGVIEYEEFIRAAINKIIFLDEVFITYAFNYFDKDKSGMITPDELVSVFDNPSINKKELKETIKNVMKETDLNGDGEICIREFAVIMAKLLA